MNEKPVTLIFNFIFFKPPHSFWFFVQCVASREKKLYCNIFICEVAKLHRLWVKALTCRNFFTDLHLMHTEKPPNFTVASFILFIPLGYWANWVHRVYFPFYQLYHFNECTFFLLEAVLHFMTGCTATEESAVVSQDVVKVLVLSGLMKW